jgi:hypothetical protein
MWEERVCILCSSEKVETKKHFILECEAFRDNRENYVGIMATSSWDNLFSEEFEEKLGAVIVKLRGKGPNTKSRWKSNLSHRLFLASWMLKNTFFIYLYPISTIWDAHMDVSEVFLQASSLSFLSSPSPFVTEGFCLTGLGFIDQLRSGVSLQMLAGSTSLSEVFYPFNENGFIVGLLFPEEHCGVPLVVAGSISQTVSPSAVTIPRSEPLEDGMIKASSDRRPKKRKCLKTKGKINNLVLGKDVALNQVKMMFDQSLVGRVYV